MMGRLKSDQGQLFYEFQLGDAVPEDHLVRKIDAALDLSWLRGELAPHYSSIGRPSIEVRLAVRSRGPVDRGAQGASQPSLLTPIII
jgi:hypothetical protein